MTVFAKTLQTIDGKQPETVQCKKFSNHSFCSHCSGEIKPQIKIRYRQASPSV